MPGPQEGDLNQSLSEHYVTGCLRNRAADPDQLRGGRDHVEAGEFFFLGLRSGFH